MAVDRITLLRRQLGPRQTVEHHLRSYIIVGLAGLEGGLPHLLKLGGGLVKDLGVIRGYKRLLAAPSQQQQGRARRG